jgi:hypothetical protein
MSIENAASPIISEFKNDPRNKVFVGFDALRISAQEETGTEVSPDSLKSVIQAYLDGECTDEQESVYDGAVYICGYVARSCFGEGPDDDIDYEIEWMVNDDGSFTAQVMQS